MDDCPTLPAVCAGGWAFEQWPWRSYRLYLLDEAGPVRMNEGGRFRFRISRHSFASGPLKPDFGLSGDDG